MGFQKFSYLALNQRPKKDTIIALFRVEPKKELNLEKIGEAIAAESSVGTWTHPKTLSRAIFEKLAAKVIEIDENKKMVKIAYPLKLFERKNICQLLSTIAGNIFSMRIVKGLRLEDAEFPERYVNDFPGPYFGMNGIRKIFGIYERPIIGCIIKPKVGLSAQKTAEIAYKVFKNGVDLVKDDETLTDMKFCKFEKRVKEVIKAKKKAERETKLRKIFVFNITSSIDEMIKRAEFVKRQGGECVMVDVVSIGFSALDYFRRQNFGLILHGHRAGHASFTRNKSHGISMLVLAKLLRLIGIDQLHTGTVVGKMEGKKEDVIKINDFLRGKFGKLKPVLPIASGGMHPALVPKLIKILGKDLVINFGGGIHGHPKGSEAGARAVKQAIEAEMKGIPLKEYARHHKELKEALDYWG
jgi:ribulose-bisphosphate carboxylase large chain